MELSKFVNKTLVEIEKGIQQARDQSSQPWIALGSVADEPVWGPEKVSFNVTVSTSTEGGGGISVMGFGDLRGERTSGSENKVSFSVPVFFNSIGPKEEDS